MKRPLSVSLRLSTSIGAVALALVGCNQLLGNTTDYVLEDSGTDASADATMGDAAGDVRSDAAMADGGDAETSPADAGDATIGAADSGTDATLDAADGGADATLDAGSDASSDAAQDAPSDSSTCNPTSSPSQNPCVITDALGVFVAPSGNDNAGQGTMASPYATIGKGILVAAANGKRVYACAGTFQEQVSLTASSDGVNIYGGLVCPGTANAWSYSGVPASVAPTATGYALSVNGLVTGATIEDVAFSAADGVNAGDSSIVAFVDSAANVTLRRVQLVAGAGVGGLSATQPDPLGQAASGLPGSDLAPGPSQDSDDCFGAACYSGAGGANSSNAPGAGHPAESVGPDGGILGYETDGGAAGTSSTPCANGENGGNGGAGAAAAGATTLGTAGASGWAPSGGTIGGPGTLGQCGGGGGGAFTSVTGGAGSGGAGGCGGIATPAGGGGGGSIALLSVSSIVVLDASSLRAGRAGTGGNGCAGQVGQQGGMGGAGYAGACSGGSGGNGGNAGPSGGGAGGISVGIVYTVTLPQLINGTSVTPGNAAFGGTGGTGGGGSGISGVAQAVLQP